MHGPINVKSPNNTSKWQMGFNSAFKGLKKSSTSHIHIVESRVISDYNNYKGIRKEANVASVEIHYDIGICRKDKITTKTLCQDSLYESSTF
jgi:hypothetical protein